MPEDSHSEERVARAVAGDELALTLLLKASRRRVLDTVSRRIPRDLAGVIDADDIVQMTHVVAFRSVRGFIPAGPDSFYRWLGTIAIRKLRDAIKHHRAQKRGGGRAGLALDALNEDSVVGLIELLAGPQRTPSRSAARHEAVEAVRQALEGLPEHYRQVIGLVHIEGKPVADVARLMGRSERAIHGLTRRGLHLLRTRLGDASAFLSSSG